MPLPERELIRRIARLAGNRRRSGTIALGIGDDAAVLRIPAGHEALVTTDFSLEGVHFRREWHPAQVVGHRCLARGLSDIAAMGGEPHAAFLSLALPANLPQPWVEDFFRGLMRLARRFKVELAGGDIAQSPRGILADIVVLGSSPRGKAVRRSGARPGDAIYVTGTLGGSAAALEALRSSSKPVQVRDQNFARHFWPEPRIAVGQRLRGRATAVIDTSDGLSVDLQHICEQSGVGAELEAEALPRAVFRGRPVPLELALHGGEDYELLFTARGSVPRTIAGVKVTRIGKIVRRRGVRVDGKKLAPRGWQHFR